MVTPMSRHVDVRKLSITVNVTGSSVSDVVVVMFAALSG
jgi:hypothetical protein